MTVRLASRDWRDGGGELGRSSAGVRVAPGFSSHPHAICGKIKKPSCARLSSPSPSHPLSPRGRFLLGTERYSKESDRKDDCDCGATWRRDADTGLQIHALTPRRVQGTDALTITLIVVFVISCLVYTV